MSRSHLLSFRTIRRRRIAFLLAFVLLVLRAQSGANQAAFVRGDTNGDGDVTLVDVIFDLQYQFQSGPLRCLAAHDSDGNGVVNLVDPLANLTYLFLAGPAPPPPFPECGIDLSEEPLACAIQPASCAANAAAFHGPIFASPVHRTGEEPVSLAIGDFDGNAVPDFAAACAASGELTLWLRDGESAYGTRSDIAIADISLAAAAAADFDGDGIPDIAVARAGNDSVSILVNDGNAVFVELAAPSLCGDPSDMAAADLDLDGDVDLVVSVPTDDVVCVLLNDGAAGFSAPVEFAGGEGPHRIALGNLDAEPAPEICIANSPSPSFSVLANDGAGTFGAPEEHDAADAPRDVLLADLSGDGALDVAAALASLGVAVCLNDGAGSLGPAVLHAAATDLAAIAAGNLDSEPGIDLAVATTDAATLAVLKNDGVGGFSQASLHPGVVDATALECADMNGDGASDLLVAGTAFDGVAVILNDGAGAFDRDYVVGYGQHSVPVGDLDADGDVATWCWRVISATTSLCCSEKRAASGRWPGSTRQGIGRIRRLSRIWMATAIPISRLRATTATSCPYCSTPAGASASR